MQRLTNQLIGPRVPLTSTDSENVRLRLSDIGYLDTSLILKTDDTVKVSIDRNIYTISTNLQIISEESTVSSSSTITLSKENFGIQEVLVNMEESNDDPAYGEIKNYTVTDNIITLNTADYNNKLTYIKYLSTK